MENKIDKGFIKVKRNILEWEWYQDGNTTRLMIHLMLKANFTVKSWQGHVINRGELITSVGNLSNELKTSESIIRTCLKKLVKTNYISTKSTNKFTKIKLNKSIIYDEIDEVNNKQNSIALTNQSQSINKPVTTTNKEKNEIEIKERKEIFRTEIFQFQNKYTIEVLNNFFNYWTEENKQTGRLKFEAEKYWNAETRLSNWKEFNSNKNPSKPLYTNR